MEGMQNGRYAAMRVDNLVLKPYSVHVVLAGLYSICVYNLVSKPYSVHTLSTGLEFGAQITFITLICARHLRGRPLTVHNFLL